MPSFSPPLDPDSEAYFKSLGVFVHVFAEVETMMLVTLALLSGINDQAAPALFSGVRVEQGSGFLRRLYEAYGNPIDPELDDALKQLAVLNTARNDLLHYGGFGSGDDRVVSTHRAAHTVDRIREFPVSSSVLDGMSEDLAEIMRALASAIERRCHPWKKLRRREYSPRAWRYKPPQPVPRPDKSRDKPSKRSRPREPSEA
jgi:hypothetical protein